jgi:hypothetical protein
MKEYTHIFASIATAACMLALFNVFFRLSFLYYVFLLLCGILARTNDWLDFKYKEHERKFLTHSPFSPVLIGISILIGSAMCMINVILGIYMMFVVHGVFLMHFFVDSLNPSGVPVMPKTRFKISEIPYDNLGWNILITLVSIVLICIWTLFFWIVS